MSLNKTFSAELNDRALVSVQGADSCAFLQALITNDLTKVKSDEDIIYACLLTPQGKFLNDFFVFKDRAIENGYLIDCHIDVAEVLLKRFSMYKMRSEVFFKNIDAFQCFAFWGEKPSIDESDYVFSDPRYKNMGMRVWKCGDLEVNSRLEDYHRHRIKTGIPEGALDIRPSLGGMQENNIDILSGLSFDKGCYLGQETVARIHYRGLVKKRLFPFCVTKENVDNISAEDDIYFKNDEDRLVKIGNVRCFDGEYGLALIKLSTFSEGEGLCKVQISENDAEIYQSEYLKAFLKNNSDL